MSAFWSFLVSLIKTPMVLFLAWLSGKSSGRKDEQLDQYERDLEAIDAANRASRNASLDPDRLRDDPYNRDNKSES